MTTKNQREGVAALVDGAWEALRVVVPVNDDLMPGWPVVLNERDEEVLSFDNLGELDRFAAALRSASEHAWAMFSLAAEPVVSVHEPSGLLEVQAGWLNVRRIPDDRAVSSFTGRPYVSRWLKRYEWNHELNRRTIGVPVGMTLREVVRQTSDSVAYREAVPRLYRALVAAEREASRTAAA